MRTERWAGIVGLVLASTVIAGIVAETIGPNLSMNAQQMHDSFRSANTAVLIGSAVLVIQKVVLVGFAAGLAALAARSERDHVVSGLILAAGTIQAAVSMVYVATYAAVASVIDQLSAPRVFAVFTVGDTIDIAGIPFLGLMFAAGAYGLYRSMLIPLWLERLGIAAGALMLLGSFTIVAPQSFFLTLPKLAGVLAGIVWLLITSIVLVRAGTASQPDINR